MQIRFRQRPRQCLNENLKSNVTVMKNSFQATK